MPLYLTWINKKGHWGKFFLALILFEIKKFLETYQLFAALSIENIVFAYILFVDIQIESLLNHGEAGLYYLVFQKGVQIHLHWSRWQSEGWMA